MQITSELTDTALLAELGTRLERTRLERNLTQEQLATEAGVSRGTVERIEAGHGANLSSFIRVLRALGLLDGMERLVPEPMPSPIERVKLRGRERQRARPTTHHEADEPWTWGGKDESA